MIDKLSYIFAKGTNPYENLALEEYLLLNVMPNEVILYLWQNENTVVIGKNQNCFKECKTDLLKQDGGHIARRLSGGGAVFHDLGNLNFTFLAKQENYDVSRQLDVILNAVNSYTLDAKKTGRNDITIGNMKFSGNAFYKNGDRCYHHGTLLIVVDMQKLSKYLNVSAEKLQSKGVSSVKSRVTNLSEFNPNITIESMKKRLIFSFGEVYALSPAEIDAVKIEADSAEIKRLCDKFSSDAVIFGNDNKRSITSCTYEVKRRFEWGDIEILLETNKSKVVSADVYSDSMDFSFVEQLKGALTGCDFSSKALADKIKLIPLHDELSSLMSEDIISLIISEDL